MPPTDLSEPPFEGACLCGAVRVRVTARPLLTFACHCSDCQKFSASAFSLSTVFPAEAFDCTGALINGGLGAASETKSEREHYFCAGCLNFIYSVNKGAQHRINLRTSVLRDAEGFAPFVEVMTDEKLPWVQLPVAHSFSSYPASAEELQSLMDRFAER